MKNKILDSIEWFVLSAVLVTVLVLLIFGGPGCASLSQAEQRRVACVSLCLARAGMDAAACREVTGTQAIDLQACILRCTCESEEQP